MRVTSGSRLVQLAAATVAALSLLGCTETVYKDFPGFTPPPAAAGSYMGYTSTTGQLPVCGNCHASHQALWATAKHSRAWADLQGSGHAGPTCDACHSVNSLGNDSLATPANGYIGDPTARYQDVQCEACHGPGENHVNNPEVTANRPVPSIYVKVGVNTSCSGCHTGTHNPFVEEWAQSAHGIVPDFAAGAGRTDCQPCHTGQVALKATMGVTNTVYKEMNNPLTTQGPNGALTIVCAVCHDPHGSPNKGQTRFPVDTNDVATNLCARCHNRRAAPDQNSNRGPHAPEGPLLIGHNDVGWRPPNMTVDPIYGSHGDTTVNKALCATCHMFKSTSTDSSGITFYSTGHLFLAIPCMDVNGKPTTGSCANTQRNFTTCAAAGCHGSGTVAMNLMETETLTLTNLLVQLGTLLNDTSKVHCSEYNSAAGSPWTTARGARFNYLLVSQATVAGTGPLCQVGTAKNLALPAPLAKEGPGVHNAPLSEQLLLNSISAVRAAYP